MGSYILCQVKKAEVPYYIESISTNIYTIEELCYYLYHNIYLVDETILNETLLDWIRNELGLSKLYACLYRLLGEETSIGNMVLPIFKEIHYLSHAQFQEFCKRLDLLEQQPAVVRQKRKGDYLVENQMYVNAIHVYEDAVTKVPESNLGAQFIGEIYHNMGCAYMHLFQLEEALTCLYQAYEQLRTKGALKQYLMAYHMHEPLEKWEQECIRMGIDPATKEEMLKELQVTTTEDVEFHEDSKNVADILKQYAKEYHKSTGV